MGNLMSLKTVIILIIVLVLILLVWMGATYNKLVTLRNKVRNGFSQIDVQLQRRFDLIPNLVETVKGYTKHENEIFSEFAKARSLYDRAKAENDVSQMAVADKGLAGALGRLMVVSEQYPQLKADANFKQLMNELSSTESKISYARQIYNDIVQKYNNKVEMFPGNIVAKIFKFEIAKFFEVEIEDARKAPTVKF